MSRAIGILLAALMLYGCAGGPPDWIAQPGEDGGLAATECVRDSGNLSLDRQATVARARAALARQLAQRVTRIEQAYAQLAAAPAGATAGEDTPALSRQTAFESVSSKVIEEALIAQPPARVEYVEIDETRQLCAMVALDGEQARRFYDAVTAASGLQAGPAASSALYEAFAGPD